MLRRALILDLETSDVDPEKGAIVEVGLIKYSLEHHAIASCASVLVDVGQGNAAEAYNGISPAVIVEDGVEPDVAFGLVRKWMTDCDLVLGHSIEFDRSFLPPSLRDLRPFVCTMGDLEWPRPVTSRSLTALALAHGLGVSHAHRALVDCDVIARLLARVHELGHDIQAMLTRGLRPKARFESLAPFERKDEVKAHGFQWEPDKKVWARTMARDDVAALPFRVKEVGP